MDKLTDEAAARAAAKNDTAFLFFKLYTEWLMDVNGEPGRWEDYNEMDFRLFEAAHDKREFIFSAVRTSLAQMIAASGIPVDKWIVEFSPILAELNIPSHLFLSRNEDARWLLP